MGWLLWVRLLSLLLLGVLGAASVIVKTKPDAKELVDKLVKFSGIIGVLAVFWGAWDLIKALLFMSLLGSMPVVWLMWLLTCAVEIGLGFVFGWGMVTSHLNDETRKKGEEFRKKLLRYQITLGWLSFVLAAWWVLVGMGLIRF